MHLAGWRRSAVLGAFGVAVGTAVAPTSAETVSFDADVRPLFTKHCVACHGGVKQAGGLSLVWRETALGETDSTDGVITPGDAAASFLLERVLDPDDDARMPPPEHGRRLNAAEVETLRAWIDQGAHWEAPWSFEPPGEEPVPSLTDVDWPRDAIDRFVLARLEAEGLAPSPGASRERWLRRVSFDLVGLPPTEAEREAFLADDSTDAHARVVDRLLASPHFGERWATVWLDLARYADTMGYERDPPRDIWPYRDWLVDAFNADTTYGEFLLKQTAGDLLPDATLADRLATAFHRNTPTNVEGGTDDEEFRHAAVVDRVDATWRATLGLTFECARCHDHPYEPIRHADYYRFAALLNTTTDADLEEEWPKLAVPEDRGRWDEANRIDRELSEVRRALQRSFANLAEGSRADWAPLAIDAVESTGETELVIRSTEGVAEVVAAGTVTDRSHYRLAGDAPPARVIALRIDALPLDPEKAIALPESGFVLSRLRVFVDRAPRDGRAAETEELFFVDTYGDEAEPFFPAADSLLDTQSGWAAYTRMRRPRWAVFVLDEPIELAAGDRLRYELKHDMRTDGQGALVLHRLRLSASVDHRWTELIASDEHRRRRSREAELVEQRDAIPSVATPVLQEQPPHLARDSYVLDRGAWLAPTDRVSSATPTSLRGEAADRLELGRWLASRENPLVARVWVNRVWAELFSRGIVPTLDDFGSTGARPSHPRLLDHLAKRFNTPAADGGWGQGLKAMLRSIALSATYRQSSRASDESLARDPDNRWLARGPRGRLRAEMVRDQALVLSGRWNPQIGGPPVMPYQPDGVWQTIYSNKRWETAEGPQRFRRALYTYWRRTAPYPSLVTFDAPSRRQCTAMRATTNTPLQALVTLNDPAYVELAEGLAERMLARSGESTRERIAWAARLTTGGPLDEASLDELTELHASTMADADGDEAFATTVVAGVILNLDAALTK